MLNNFYVGSLLLISVLFASRVLLHAAEGSRPNIVVLWTDDQGYADVRTNGCKDYLTPHLDSLAKDGLRCTAGDVSQPQCLPSRAGILTGAASVAIRLRNGNLQQWELIDSTPQRRTENSLMKTDGVLVLDPASLNHSDIGRTFAQRHFQLLMHDREGIASSDFVVADAVSRSVLPSTQVGLLVGKIGRQERSPSPRR